MSDKYICPKCEKGIVVVKFPEAKFCDKCKQPLYNGYETRRTDPYGLCLDCSSRFNFVDMNKSEPFCTPANVLVNKTKNGLMFLEPLHEKKQ